MFHEAIVRQQRWYNSDDWQEYLDYLFRQPIYAHYQMCDFHLMKDAAIPTQQLDVVNLKG